MHAEIIAKSRNGTLRQISIYAENKVGRFNDLIKMLAYHDVHIMALCTVDTTDSALIRLLTDNPEKTFELLITHNFSFNVAEVLGLEIETEQYLKHVTGALMEAEINIHYIYPFLMRPNGRSGLVLRLEDPELASDVLKRHGLKILSESDICR